MQLTEFFRLWQDSSPYMEVCTSGSTGQPKKILVEKKRMEASALTTCQFLGLQPGDTALLCLPLDYIAGKMMAIRAHVAHLKLIDVPPSSHPLKDIQVAPDFAAMIPMQVICSMEQPQEKSILMNIRHLIIGGGPVAEPLKHQLSHFPNYVWSTYGMTETLSHIALRKLNGEDASDWYCPLPGISVHTDSHDCLVIHAPAICPKDLITHDIGQMPSDGYHFRILGRTDNIICSGGIKLQIETLEQSLTPHLSHPFIITSTPHPLLGECVTLLTEDIHTEEIDRICRNVLPEHHHPHRIYHVRQIPLTETGKPARAQAQQLAKELLKESPSH